MIRRLFLSTAVLLAVAGPALAAGWDAPFALALPQEDLAMAAIDAFPDVSRAKAELTMAEARARELAAGPYEFTVNANTADNYPKFTWDVARTIRLPSKAALDRKAGSLGVSAAQDLVDDARHQTGLILSDAWYGWIEAEAGLAADREIEASIAREVEALEKREAEKDASRLEVEQATAALASAAARRAASEGAAATAKLALARNFPNLPLPANPPALPEPPPLERPAAEWAEITVANSHEIAIADFQAQQAAVEARRAKLDRTPDPTVGIRGVPDMRPGGGYALNGIGVFVSIPIGGARRAAIADGSSARASVAEINLARIKRESAALGERNAVNSEAARRAWRSTLQAVEAGEAASARTYKAYQLGEVDLAQTLLATRQFAETKRAEIAARVAAWKAVTHLRLDSHDLWHDSEPPPAP
jgi:outer membrane protein TolC